MERVLVGLIGAMALLALSDLVGLRDWAAVVVIAVGVLAFYKEWVR